jgi:hypothetical protein
MPAVEPRTAFNTEALLTPIPLQQRSGYRGLRAAACSALDVLRAPFRAFGAVSTRHLALAGLAGIAALTVSILRQPQHSDAVTANVPLEAIQVVAEPPRLIVIQPIGPLTVEAMPIDAPPAMYPEPGGLTLSAWEGGLPYPHPYLYRRRMFRPYAAEAVYLGNYGR